MTNKKVLVSYDHEGDMLEVLWALKSGYFTPTEDERILKRLGRRRRSDRLSDPRREYAETARAHRVRVASEAPADDVANVTIREAAIRLGISERRVRKLARDGRVRGATKAGSEWLIPTPVELIPAKRGPVGVAGRAGGEAAGP